jgi:glycosyltransferase involved in cell wall biosynthesis
MGESRPLVYTDCATLDRMLGCRRRGRRTSLSRRTLDIVVPAYDEEQRIVPNLSELCAFLSGLSAEYSWRLIVVDDGSSDRTGSLVEAFAARNAAVTLIHHRENRGMGAALRTGFEESRADFVVTVDADLSYSPAHVGRLVETLRQSGADLVLASAYMERGCVANVPTARRWLSWCANRYLSWASGGQLHTATCVVRGYLGTSLRSLKLLSEGVEINLEILQQALRRGMTIREIPAELHWREEETTGRRLRLPVVETASRVLRTLTWGARVFHTRLAFGGRSRRFAQADTYD